MRARSFEGSLASEEHHGELQTCNGQEIDNLFSESRRKVDVPLAQALSIVPEFYLDPKIFELEVARLFRPGWLCVGRASQIPAKGDHFCCELFGERLLIVRGEDDRIRALSAVCSHRAALVAEEPGCSPKLVCPYHRWTYDLEGRFLSAPFMPGAAVGRDLDLPRFRCETWLGWIMINLDGAAAPFADGMAELTRELAPWNVERMVPLCAPVVYEGAYNWKIVCDNQGESYHLIGPHAVSVAPYVDPRDSRFTSDGRTYVKSWFPAHSGAVGPVFGARLPGVPEAFNGSWSYNVFPCHLFVMTDDFVIWQLMKIHGHDRLTLEMWVLGAPEIAADPAMQARIDEVRDGVVMVEGEDQGAFRSVWKGLQAASARPGPFAESERGTWFWQQWLTSALEGAAEAPARISALPG